jgi:hypothetical protein
MLITQSAYLKGTDFTFTPCPDGLTQPNHEPDSDFLLPEPLPVLKHDPGDKMHEFMFLYISLRP